LERNPYAAPTADVGVPTATISQPAWFAVGTRKLFVMSVLTFGLYTIHWFERQYRFQKSARGESLMPLARGIFSIFYAKDLFQRVEGAAARANIGQDWTASGMAGLFIVSAVLGRIMDRVSGKLTTGALSAVLALGSSVLLLGLAYPLVRVQGTVNQVLDKANPNGERNESFTLWNWLLMLVGGGLLVLGVIGSFMPGE
jgi:MFS family permease